MHKFRKIIKQFTFKISKKNTLPVFLLIAIISAIYYKFFIFGQIPFPGDLLVNSYAPWFTYFKTPVLNPSISDVFSQFYVWKYLAVESMIDFSWPLWNPYSFTGNALLATYHSASLYPLNLLLALSNSHGWGLFIFSQSLIAGISFFVYVSLFTTHSVPKIIGSLIFAFGGLMTTWLELGTAPHAMAWVPLTLFALEKISKIDKMRYYLLLTSSLSLIILAGSAQVTTYSFILIAFYTLFLFFTKQFITPRKQLFKIILFILLPIGITAIQLLPSLDFMQKSIRSTEEYTKENNFGLLALGDIFKLFFPNFFGHTSNRNYWGFLNYNETASFIGTLSLPLFIYSFFYTHYSKIKIFFSLVFIFTLIFAFDNPLSNAIYSLNIPLLTSSYASRILFITTLSASVIIALAIEHLLTNLHTIRKFTISVIYSLAIMLGIYLGLAATAKIIQSLILNAPTELILQTYLKDGQYNYQNLYITFRNLAIPNILLLGLFFLILLSKYFSKYFRLPILISIFFIVLFTFDLARYFLKFNPFVDKSQIFPSTETIKYLQNQDGIFRVGRENAEVFPPNTWTAYNLQSFEGYDPIYPFEYSKVIKFLNGGDLKTESLGRYAELSSKKYVSKFLDSANVKYFMVVLRDNEGKVPGNNINYVLKETPYKLVFVDKSTGILENPNALPRAKFYKSYMVDSLQKNEETMSQENFDPTQTVLLEKDLHFSSPLKGEGSIQITEYKPNSIILKTKTASEELLVLSDQYDSGWKATIDSRQETPVIRANLVFRAIKVPAGDHEIKFYYWPYSFQLGLKITLLTLLSLIVLSAISVYRKRF